VLDVLEEGVGEDDDEQRAGLDERGDEDDRRDGEGGVQGDEERRVRQPRANYWPTSSAFRRDPSSCRPPAWN
jgi:hypothetical protein